ncbi:MAG: glutathione synthase [Rhodobacteraceae bacterium]|nr:glutathione synthase [Paracoccaceae bacterium]
MKIAFQMDPITAVDINADSSFRLAEEAQARGHSLFHYLPEHLAYEEGTITARGSDMVVQRGEEPHAELGPEKHVDLATFDVLWLRQDPPFDMHYITATHLLERLKDRVLVVNNPFWVRNCPEKLLVLDFAQLAPPTTIARDLRTLRAFREKYGDVIVKPLYGNGGAGVFYLGRRDSNLASLHELFTSTSREPLIVQKFLPEVVRGDKRVILVDGVAVGAINRVPAQGETRSNLHVGGRAEPAMLSARDHAICAAIGPRLRDRGLIFVGIDVIGEYLTEINVTSPTGVQELERFDKVNIAARIWQTIEAQLA